MNGLTADFVSRLLAFALYRTRFYTHGLYSTVLQI